MEKDPPRGVDADWVETYIAGHRKGGTTGPDAQNEYRDGADDDRQSEAFADSDAHRQLSYVPLPSIGTEHTDPGVRRVMIVAPTGDRGWLDHVARRLAGQELKPVRGDEFEGRLPPLLVPVRRDNIARFYAGSGSTWHSVTPVILPGHDDHKPDKTRALIERALIQSGIDQACEFEWSAFSRFSKSFSAHKYDKDKRPQGYIRPTYLLSQTAVHLTLRFHDGSEERTPVNVPGPLVIGAGRHCGLGILASLQT
jgi:CRISPR-associated protein Csb2